MVGKTERTLKRNIIDPLVDWLGERRCKYVQGNGELWLLGRRIYVAGANDERSMDKIRGLTLAGAYVDEISVIPESFWSMLLTRLSIEGAQLFGTTNPDNPNHWLMRDYLKKARLWLRHDGHVVRHEDDGRRLDLHRFSFRLRDNPSLPAAYIRSLELEFAGLWRLRFVEGLWVLAEGAIFDMFDEDLHVVDDLPRDAGGRVVMDEWIIAIDYGTTNPFVALLIGVGRDSDDVERIWVAREWRWDSHEQHQQKTDAEYSTALRAWLDHLQETELPGLDVAGVYVDPSAASFIAQLWRDHWQGVHGADNAVLDGIRSVSSLYGADRLRIHRSCSTGHRSLGGSDNNLVGETTGYVWDPKAAEKGEEKPLKVDDHGPDAKRYGIMAARVWWRHWMTGDMPEAA
jgi:PBSX family phage terminase large subunit